MNEVNRISNFNDGEIPDEGNYGFFIVENIDNPAKELDVFKNVVRAILQHPDLEHVSSKWNKILPQQFVKFTDQLEENDYHKDELLSNIPRIVNTFRTVRDWEWYSSKLLDNGFEVTYTGKHDNMLGIILLHHQGLPFTCLFSEEDENFYETKNFGTDVLSYKKYDKQFLKLK